MNIDKIRSLYKILTLVALVLFVVMLIDFFANDAGMMTLLVILFLIVAIIMILLLFLKPSSDAEPEAEPQSEPESEERMDYPGDVHEVVDLEGIGPAFAEKLHAAGIYNTQELLFADDEDIQAAVGVPPKTVANWKSMSQLAKVNGIGPQYAEALTRGGIQGIEGLRDGSPAEMTDKVNAYLDGLKSTVIGQRISEKRMAGWQKSAKKMQKVPIDMASIKIKPLGSKAARADAAST